MILAVTGSEKSRWHGVAAERTTEGVVIRKYLQSDDLKAMIADAGVKEVATAFSPPDVSLAVLQNQDKLGRARNSAAHLEAERAGFEPTDSIRLVDERGTTYVSAVRREQLDVFARMVKESGGTLTYVGHSGYAWASLAPPNAQVVLVVDRSHVRMIVIGRERNEDVLHSWADFGTSGAPERSLAATISEDCVEAVRSGFADVERVAVFDPDGRLMPYLQSEFVHTEIISLPCPADREPWMLAQGIALRALGGGRLNVNYADDPSEIAAALRSITRLVSKADVAVVSIGLLISISLVGWRAETLSTVSARAAAVQQSVKTMQAQAVSLDQLTRAVSSARSVAELVEQSRRSGPLLAREVSALADDLGPSTTATTLVASGTTWSLSGHIADLGDMGSLLGSLSSAGFQPGLTGTQTTGGAAGEHLSYNLTLGAPQ